MAEQRAVWGSRTGFVLAAAGSAVGLGNIWKFPYITGENGGGLFVLIYLICIALVGLPIMLAEIMIGRAAQKQPVEAFHTLQGRRSAWAGIGWLGLVAGFIILSYYIIVAGWAMDYTLKSVVNFTQPIHQQAEMQATEYLARTSIDDMRERLIAHEADHASRDEIKYLRNRLAPSAWRDHARFEAAIVAAGNEEQARSRLMSDPALRVHVEQAEGVLREIESVRAAALRNAAGMFADDQDVMAKAQAMERRAVIFSRVQSAFIAVATDGWTSMGWAALFMLITIWIVSGGVSAGIERTCRILMPVLLMLILFMVTYGVFQPGFSRAFGFVFSPDPQELRPSGVLEALGHSFFTLSLGMGAMITYGSYQRTKTNLGSQSVLIAGLDTAIALLACMMIFPIIFSYGQEPSAGPGLVFMSMPLAFAEIGRGGMLLAILFFGLLVFAALTSSISLLEVVASYFIDGRGWSRQRAAWTLGGCIFLFAIPSGFAMDPNFAMAGWEPSFGLNFFDTMDYLASNWMLPLGGLFIAIYAGWVMPRRLQEAEVQDMAPAFFAGWVLLVRLVAPALVIIVLCQKVGILDADELFHALFQ